MSVKVSEIWLLQVGRRRVPVCRIIGIIPRQSGLLSGNISPNPFPMARAGWELNFRSSFSEKAFRGAIGTYFYMCIIVPLRAC